MTQINAEKYRERLLARKRELVEEAAQFDVEAREAGTDEVQDPIDAATSDEEKTTSFQLGDMAARALQQVRAALDRRLLSSDVIMKLRPNAVCLSGPSAGN